MIAGIENEHELISQVAEGNDKAFRHLFDHYWNKIYSVAIALTKSSSLSEELVQDVFLKIWLNREQLTSVKKFDAYLFTVARNHIYNELRKKTNEQPFVEHLEQYFHESFSLPEQTLLLKETTQLINRAIEKLPEQQRTVYILSRHEGLDYHAIAGQMGIARSTVKNHMTKALQFLREQLAQNFGELLLSAVMLRLFG